MGIVEILALIGTVIKFASMLMEKYKSTPSEKRRESLAQMDKAIENAHKKDLRDLSSWIGGRL